MTKPSRLQELEDEIGDRLAPLCTRMSADEFATMVRDMAAIRYKYEIRATADFVRMDLALAPQRPDAAP